MPEFVEQLFGRAAGRVGVRLEAAQGRASAADRARPARAAQRPAAARSSASARRRTTTASSPSARRCASAPSTRTRCCSLPAIRCTPPRSRRCATASRAVDGGRRAVRRAVGDRPVRDPLLHLRGARARSARPARAGVRRAGRRRRGRRRPRARLPGRAARPHAVGVRAARARRARSRRDLRRATNHVRAVIQIAERRRVSEERAEQARLRSRVPAGRDGRRARGP